MGRKSIITTLFSSAIIIGSAASAYPGPGGGGGGGGGMGGPPAGLGGMGGSGGLGVGGQGGIGGMGNGSFGNGGLGGDMRDTGVTMRNQARVNSQGLAHASATGVAHANANSVLVGTTATNVATRGALTGLTTGTTLYSNGTAVGTVQQIRTTGNGSVALVLVKSANGGIYPIPASKLTYSRGSLTTSARLTGVNDSNSTGVAMRTQARANSKAPLHASATGIAHVNQNSVLFGASGRTNLTGVTTGMSVLQNGAQVGAVTRVVTNEQGAVIRVLVQGTNGRIYSLAPSNVSVSGSTLIASGLRI